MPRPDDISSLWLSGRIGANGSSTPGSTATAPLQFGELLAFNNTTGENAVRINTLRVENVPVNDPQLALSLYAGQTVLVGLINQQYVIMGAPGVTGGKLEVLGGEIVHVNGPTPPVPSAPTVTPTFLGLVIGWDGSFADGAEITPDWSRVEVHASDTSGFNPDPATFRAALSSPEGGEVTIPFPPETGERYVRLVSRSLTGNRSGPSDEVAGTPGTKEDFIGDIGSGTTIFSAPFASPPMATGIGDWWYTSDTAQAFRWDGATWVEVDLPGVADALAEALLAQTIAETKVRVFRQAGEPTAEAVGDLWIDTDADNQMYTWDGDSWELFQFGTLAFQPGSIVASVIIATGTITGPLVEAQAITGDKIAANSITAAHGVFAEAAIQSADIAEINAGKIQSGTVNADLTVSGSVKTAPSGARSQMDAQGFRTFDMAENEVIEITGNNELAVDTQLLLPGGLGDMVTTPDTAALDITGDIDIRVRVAMDNWLPGASQYLIGKTGTDSGSAYGFLMDQTNRLRITWSPDGNWHNSRNFVANAATGFADGTVHWVRATVDVDNGAGGCTGTFYVSENGTSWTQLGTSINAGGTSSIFAGTLPLAVGAKNGTTGDVPLAGKVWAAEVRNGIAGTIVANPVFTSQAVGAGSFADGTGKTWTLNNNAELVAQPGSGGVPEINVRNPTNNSRVQLLPATDDLGATVEARLYPGDLAGHPWTPGRLSAGIDNAVADDDRPVVRLIGPLNADFSGGGGQTQPAIALYGRGDVTTLARMNLFSDEIAFIGQMQATSTNMQTLETVQSTTQGPFTNTTYGAGTVNCGFSFVAPMSGKVMITVSGELRAHGAFVQAVVLGFEIRLGGTVGSGTVVVATDDDRSIRWQPITDNGVIEASYSKLATGLTPGTTYNVRTMHKITGVGGGFSGTIHFRQVAVQPQLG